MIRALAVLSAAAFACLGSAAASRIEPWDSGGWLEIGVRNLVVIGNAPPDELRALARELGLFDAVVERLTTAPPRGPEVPVRLYVFAKAEHAKRFTGWAAGVLVPTLPGYFAILSADGPDFATRQTLFHEYAHYVLHRNRRIPYPRWYDEGLSEYLAAIRFLDDGILVGAAPSHRLESLQRGDPMSLPSLFEEPTVSGQEVYPFYATSWALVHYLNSSAPHRAGLRRFAARLASGEDWRPAFAASFEESPEELEAGLADHIDRLRRGARFDFLLPPASLLPEEYWRESPVAPAEISYQLGTIARLMAEWPGGAALHAEAKALFEEAVAHDGSHPRARAALAWSRAVEGRFSEADELLQRARREAPEDPRVGLEAGRVRAIRASATSDRAEAEAACEALERAARLGPELAEAHAEVARGCAAAGRAPRETIAAFERARELGAWSPRLDLELARAYLGAGDPTRAEALLAPVAIEVHSGEVAEAARALLDSIRSGASHRAERPR